VTDNIYKELWKKLILNTAYNGYTCLIEGALKYFYDVPEAVEMFHKTLKEGQMLSRLEGYDITDEEINEIMLVTKSEGFLNFKTSTLQDLEKGKPLEIDAIQGVLLQIAEKHNVEVPLNKFIFAMLRLKMLNKKFG
jgi:2-dehydropantoate 2-reductase